MFSAARRPVASLPRLAAHPAARRLAATAGKTRRRPNAGIAAGLAGAVSLTAGAGLFWWSTLASPHDGMPTLDGPFPLSERTPYAAFLPPALTPDDVTRLLSENAFSGAPRDCGRLTRYHGAQLASNSPCEDRLVHGTIASPYAGGGSRWAVWAVLDGHAGAATADVLSRALVPYVQHRLREVCGGDASGANDVAAVKRAIAQAFVELDTDMMAAATAAADTTTTTGASLASKIRTMMPAFAGSCALLALYDPDKGRLHVACTGDSRAVLGRQNTLADDDSSSGTWEAVPLTVDQTGRNADEVARLQAEHPGEDATLVKDGRVLGLAVSRAFGDGRWKWPLAFQQSIRRRFYAPPPLTPTYDVRTPPYLTAEPVVTTVHMGKDPNQRYCLILATDGLWDHVKSQQAVDLVGRWLDPAEAAAPPAASSTMLEKQKAETNSTGDASEPFDFGHFWKGVSYKFQPERTVVEDANAAVHLIRNSLGGNHGEMLAGRLTFDAPFSRRLRDDTTVQVVFFNC
ncbi:hypothetical protein SCUCBS95973_005883 [Sporothrix curviconia]|uniref:PPM-type phosphatase domain-containing protein n=1 Tax=Sporothrix curviconia TaxID=1260050 RepID=A0ABP0C0J8_9PEZI